jgi:hypothetical protein
METTIDPGEEELYSIRRSGRKWTKDFDLTAMEDLRKAFVAKYENTPKYKFGVQIPTSISHALRLDKLNVNNFWQEAIQKEMDLLVLSQIVLLGW